MLSGQSVSYVSFTPTSSPRLLVEEAQFWSSCPARHAPAAQVPRSFSTLKTPSKHTLPYSPNPKKRNELKCRSTILHSKELEHNRQISFQWIFTLPVAKGFNNQAARRDLKSCRSTEVLGLLIYEISMIFCIYAMRMLSYVIFVMAEQRRRAG